MPSVLITAFEPYDCWDRNSSWLTLVELTRELPVQPQITTRLYPVDFAEVKHRLEEDLVRNYDFALHLGQAPSASALQLEAIGVNIGGSSQDLPEEYRPLVDGGPVALRSPLPLGRLASRLRGADIPVGVSYHAGTYLCNATLFLSLYLAETMRLKTQATFIHLPLDISQITDTLTGQTALPCAVGAAGVRLILGELLSIREASELA